jgi:hypothetical protein
MNWTRILTVMVVLAVGGAAYAIDSVYVRDRGGTVVSPGELVSITEKWTVVGSISASQGVLGVTSRTVAILDALPDANQAGADFIDGTNGIHFRFRTNATDNDVWVVEVYNAAKGDQYLDRIATLTLTTGTQAANSGYTFVDTIAETNANGLGTWKVIHSGDNYIASYAGYLAGMTRVRFIASTLPAGHTLYIDARRF